MTGRRLALAALLTLTGVMCGCASPPEAAVADTAAAGEECVTGAVILEGVQFAPRTWVRSATGVYVELAGPLVANVRLLSGTTVRVCGRAPAPDGAFHVGEVELIEVDRMPAVLGTLRETATRWAVEPLGGGDPVLLNDVPEAFAEAAGQIVWVAGELADEGITVRSYGVLEGWR